MTDTWETVDGLILSITLIGFVLLIILMAKQKCWIAMKTKIVYILSLGIVIFTISTLFGFTDPVFASANYFITPLLVLGRLVGLFAIHLLVDHLYRRKSRADKSEC